MPAAALRTKPSPTQSTAQHPVLFDSPYQPPTKRPLPAGRPRDWYVSHNRRLKAMRLAIALLDSGIYLPAQAHDEAIRDTAAELGMRPPSGTTCHMVRAFMRYSR
ncbi:hypothetical protein NX794_28605 [Streptomyces sp. LP11]|uniref:Uncharacterized protein n=1 Tax=Streptomyces pyxinicus TaxID=2970331 RepID=A0ABT2B9F2_9ACTN|nr:hypothetical protein [Streptomyces sp. LP11]MCS0605141.1 hypothetical protein [Streptomyces sp. LP11]